MLWKRKRESEDKRLNPYPFWAPRIWHGMMLSDWFHLAAEHRFKIHPRKMPMAIIVTAIAVLNSALYRIQRLKYGKRIDAVTIEHPPLFIVGHWRSGTTMLHELIVGDERHAYPTTYECFAPNHFLVTGKLFPKLFRILLPAKRPMDNMAVSFDHPQEDEFALVSMGAPSPLLRIAFPNDPPPHLEFLDMRDVAPAKLEKWKSRLVEFVRCQTLLKRKCLVLKSPTHTGRVRILRELFPGAKFIHIVRNPKSLFPSNRRLWQALDEVQGFQVPHHRQLDDFVFEGLERMYSAFEEQRTEVPPQHLAETRYEDLIADPLREVKRLYAELDLGDFENIRSGIEKYVANRKDYKTNRHDLEPEVEGEIERRWSDYLHRYGYASDE